MAPSFYDASSPPSILASASNASSESRLPTLPVILGLLGGLATATSVAVICIHLFRGRIFGSSNNVEDKCSRTTEGSRSANRSSCFSVLSNDEILCEDSKNTACKGPALRPFLLNLAKIHNPQQKELILPLLQRIHADNVPSEPIAMRKSTIRRGGRNSLILKGGDSAVSATMRVSSSCPANLHDYNPIEQQRGSAFENATLTEEHSQACSSISSSDSSSSAYSEEDTFSSSTSLPWDYYLNNIPDDLFYTAPPTPIEDSEAEHISTEAVDFDIASGCETDERFENESQLRVELPIESSDRTAERHGRIHIRCLPLSKRSAFAVTKFGRSSKVFSRSRRTQIDDIARSMRRRELRMRNAKFVALRSREDNLIQQASTLGSIRGDSKINKRKIGSLLRSISKKPHIRAGARLRATSAKARLTRSKGFSAARHPLSTITNTSRSPSVKRSPIKAKTRSPQRTRPSLQLNGIPADDVALGPMASIFSQHRSPPRNPALLNTRWAPRPAVPPVRITVFAKNRSIPVSTYPGRRLTLTPPAGMSLAELRGSIERGLGHDVRLLRGMVFVGKHSMFLPLLSERFYMQWVKERAREGGIGVVEAWHH